MPSWIQTQVVPMLMVLALGVAGCHTRTAPTTSSSTEAPKVMAEKTGQAAGTYTKPSNAEIRAKLNEVQYQVTQHDGTERPFTNAFFDNKEAGIYVDIVSGEPLFSSTDKFKSGTGWPSFSKPLVERYVVEHKDVSHGMVRTEVRSKIADSHLGHVFNDGPQPSGQRYCINSASLRFIPASKLTSEGYGQFAALFADDAMKTAMDK